MSAREQVQAVLTARYRKSADNLDEIAFWPLASNIIDWTLPALNAAGLVILRVEDAQKAIDLIRSYSPQFGHEYECVQNISTALADQSGGDHE